MYMTNYY